MSVVEYSDCSKCRNRVPTSVLLEASDGTQVCRNCLLDIRIGPKGSKSVRVHDELWESARIRAESEGLPINTAIEELLEGYARGHIDMPQITREYKRGRRPSVEGLTSASD